MPEKTPFMSTKRAKLTAGKARERIASLEESISARQHRLEQLEARLERSEAPDERLLTAKTNLERRLLLERDQLEKLLKLLGRDIDPPEESGEFFASEEIDDLHRSFEEVRQNLAQMQARIDSTEMPRDLTSRLSSFEERVSRREEVDSELYSQVLSLQTALDQERQAVRRLSRRTREQDQSLDALREAVEDSVVATVDLAERLEELEDTIGENAEVSIPSAEEPVATKSELTELRIIVDDTKAGLLELQRQVSEALDSAQQEFQELHQAVAELNERLSVREPTLARAETLPEPPPATREAQFPSGPSSDDLKALQSRLESLERLNEAHRSAPSVAELATTRTNGATPAVFAKSGSPSRRAAVFEQRPSRTR